MVDITTQKLNQTVHKAVICEAALRELAVAAVAAQLGLDAMSEHIEVKTNVYTPMHGDKGERSPRIEVTLIDHHERKPRIAIECSADGSASKSIEGDGSGQALPMITG
jgi:hypothetical protein